MVIIMIKTLVVHALYEMAINTCFHNIYKNTCSIINHNIKVGDHFKSCEISRVGKAHRYCNMIVEAIDSYEVTLNYEYRYLIYDLTIREGQYYYMINKSFSGVNSSYSVMYEDTVMSEVMVTIPGVVKIPLYEMYRYKICK